MSEGLCGLSCPLQLNHEKYGTGAPKEDGERVGTQPVATGQGGVALNGNSLDLGLT